LSFVAKVGKHNRIVIPRNLLQAYNIDNLEGKYVKVTVELIKNE